MQTETPLGFKCVSGIRQSSNLVTIQSKHAGFSCISLFALCFGVEDCIIYLVLLYHISSGFASQACRAFLVQSQ